MQAADALAQMRVLPMKDFAAAFGAEPVLILAPHPDDESLGCGGLIAEACRQGQPPFIVILTDGSQSHPNSREYPAERLRALREAEAQSAIAELGMPPERLVFLRYPDSAAPCEGKRLDEAAERLADLITRWRCKVVAVSWRHDPHCDHAAAAAIAEAACRRTGARLLAYPVWGWTLSPEAEIDTAAITGFRLDVTRHLPAKRAAIAAHRSQYAGIITDDPEGFQLPPDFIDAFLVPTETFIDVDLST
jgi:LmbE family N-acetylglucosaminyl deacetylase